MEIATFFLWLGSIASIVGAAVSIWKAYRAVKSADRAEIIKNDLISRRNLQELSGLMNETKNIHEIFRKYENPQYEQMSGNALRDDIEKLQKFIFSLRDSQGSFDNDWHKIQEIMNNIDNIIENIPNDPMISVEAQVSTGNEIFKEVKRIHSCLRKVIDKSDKEHVQF